MGKSKKRQHAATNEDAVLDPEAAVVHKAAKKAKLANGSAKPTATVSSVEEEGPTLAPAPAAAAAVAEAAEEPARKEKKKKKSKKDSKKDKDERKEKKDGKIRDKEGKKPGHATEDLVASNDDDQAMGEGDGMNGDVLGAGREIQATNGEEQAEAVSDAQADAVPNGDGSKDKKRAKEEKKAKKDKKNKEEKKDKKSKKAKKSAEQDLAPPAADENGTGADEDEDEDDDDDGANASENGEGGKAARFICFIGNLPFTATSETVRAHFSALQPASVRLLTQRDDAARSRGIAFVEFASYDRMRTCLTKFHHSEFNDGVSPVRKINVELTAGGGGTTKIRKDKIKAKNEKLNEERHKKAGEAKQLKKEGKDVEGEDASESRGQPEHNAIHPSRLAMMQGPELEEKQQQQQQQRGQGRGGRGGGGSRGGAAGRGRSQHGRWQQKSRR